MKMKRVLLVVLLAALVYFICNDVVLAKQVDLNFASGSTTCRGLLGPNLTNVVKYILKVFQIIAIIFTVVKSMLILMAAVSSKDADALGKSLGTIAKLFVILAIILLFPTLIKLIGNLFGFDVSCFF